MTVATRGGDQRGRLLDVSVGGGALDLPAAAAIGVSAVMIGNEDTAPALPVRVVAVDRNDDGVVLHAQFGTLNIAGHEFVERLVRELDWCEGKSRLPGYGVPTAATFAGVSGLCGSTARRISTMLTTTSQINRATIGTNAIEASSITATTMLNTSSLRPKNPVAWASKLRQAMESAAAAMPATPTNAKPMSFARRSTSALGIGVELVSAAPETTAMATPPAAIDAADIAASTIGSGLILRGPP